MIWWVWFTAALACLGLRQGPLGFFTGIGVGLMLLPFWFVVWVVWQVPV